MKTLYTPKNVLVSVALIALASTALAQGAMKMTVVAPDELTWKDNPSLPKGAQTAVLVGDPTQSGEMFVTRTKLPPNYQIPAHTHPMTEGVTVISGTIYLGEGDKLDMQKGKMLTAGSYFLNPAKHAHYGWTTNEGAVVQGQAIGPGGIDYINPADDPRKTQ
jgi:quercetin dioxygenase-like cupin family protein